MSGGSVLLVRPERPGDAGAIRAVHLRAFARDGHEGVDEADAVEGVRGSPAFIPSLSLVADVDGQVIGHLLISRAAIETPRGAVPCLALAPLGVLPGYEKRHAGTHLMRTGLAEGARLGFGAMAVLGHPKYYRHFGFRSARPLGITCRWRVPDEVFMVRELVPGALAGVAGEIRYAAAFDRL